MTSRRHSLLWIAAAALPAGARTADPAPSPGAAAPPVSTVPAVPTIRLVATEFPPYTGAALPGGGVAAEITRAALAQAGLGMTLEFRPWARALLEFQRGMHDGVIAAWHSAERARSMVFPQPLGIVNQIGFMARADRRHRVDDLARLKGLRIGVVNGYANPERFERAELAVEGAVDDLANLRKLLAGRVDLALIDKGVAFSLLDSQLPEAAGRLVWLEPAVTELPLYTVFARSAPGERLAQSLDRGLAEMQNSGRLAQLLQQRARWQ